MKKARVMSRGAGVQADETPPHKGFPTTVVLFGQRWEVKYVSPVDRDESLMGAADICERIIYLDRTMAPEAMLDTLIHEIAHAYFETSPITLDPDLEENLAKFVATVVIDMMRANVEIVNLIAS